MNPVRGQLAVQQAEPGDQVARMWAARFVGTIEEAAGPRRCDPGCLDTSPEREFSVVAAIGAGGMVMAPVYELAGRRSFDHRGRNRRTRGPMTMMVEGALRPSMIFAPHLLA